ncbi:MAG: Flp pilus assembly protein CpaB [Acidimicrobiia bacterium]
MSTGEPHLVREVPGVLGEQPSPRRRLTSRIGLLHVVAVASGLLAFLLILSWMRASQQLLPVAVAVDTIRAGTLIDPGAVEFVEVSADAAFDGRVLSPADMGRLDGSVATRQITAGEPILDTDLRPVDVPAGLRAMSVPLDPSRAAGGDLAVGDRVDLIGTADGGSRYIAVGLAVIGVPGPQSSTFGTGNAYAVTVAVDAEEALAIAAALDGGKVHLLRSTGAPEVAGELLAPPDEDSAAGSGGATDGGDDG